MPAMEHRQLPLYSCQDGARFALKPASLLPVMQEQLLRTRRRWRPETDDPDVIQAARQPIAASVAGRPCVDPGPGPASGNAAASHVLRELLKKFEKNSHRLRDARHISYFVFSPAFCDIFTIRELTTCRRVPLRIWARCRSRPTSGSAPGS